MSRFAGRVLVAWLCVAGALAEPGLSSSGPFGWLMPRAAPAAWHRVKLPGGGGVLSYPTVMRPLSGDRGTVSVAVIKSGRFLAYLNVTPKQGRESVVDWPAFRLEHQRGEAVSVHEVASVVGRSFENGRGSCVIDDYVTVVKHNAYREIACFVQGSGPGSVIIAAAPPAQWSRFGPTLERAISAFQVR